MWPYLGLPKAPGAWAGAARQGVHARGGFHADGAPASPAPVLWGLRKGEGGSGRTPSGADAQGASSGRFMAGRAVSSGRVVSRAPATCDGLAMASEPTGQRGSEAARQRDPGHLARPKPGSMAVRLPGPSARQPGSARGAGPLDGSGRQAAGQPGSLGASRPGKRAPWL